MRFIQHTIFFFFILLLTFNAKAQNWLYHAGGNAHDEALDMARDAAGNLYTTGYFSLGAQFGTQVINSTGNGDVFIAKQQPNGAYQWVVKGGGGLSDRGYGITTDVNGNVIVTGFFSGQATFGSTTLTSYNGSQDVFVAKLDSSGNYLWAIQLGGTDIDISHSVTCDASGTIFVTGQFRDTAWFGTNTFISETDPYALTPSYDIFITALSPTGTVQWAKQGKAKFDDRGLDIAVDSNNDVYVCGQFSDTLTFSNTYNNNSYNCGFVLKMDNNGNELWFKRILATQVTAYALRASGTDVYVTGEFMGQLAVVGTPTTYLNNNYFYNVFLLKLNTSGGVTWVQADGSDNYVTATELDLDNQGNIYITGMFKCSFTEYSLVNGSGIFYSIGFRDVFCSKYSATGQRLWERQYGGPGDDFCSALTVKSPDHPVMSGSYQYYFTVPSTGNLTMNPGNINTTNLGPGNGYYCSDANYGQFVSSPTNGNRDIFCTDPFTSTRNDYDYFVRGGAACVRDTISPYINIDQDTLSACDSLILYANLRTGKDGVVGPRYKYLWSTGSTQDSITVFTTGTYTLKMWHEDECRIFYDTVYVKITPSPSTPTVISPTHLLLKAIPLSGCDEKLTLMAGDSALVIGQNFNPLAPHYWITPQGTVFNDSLYISQFGNYTFMVEAPNGGCPAKTCISAYLYTNSNCGNSTPLVPELHLTDPLFDAIDTVTVCVGDYFGMDLVDSTNFANGIPTILYTFAHWTITGGYAFDPYASYPYTFGTHHQEFKAISSGMCTAQADVLNPLNGTVMHTALRTFYLHAVANPVSTLSVTGPSSMCPGDTVIITASGSDHYNWNGPSILSYNSDSSQITANMNGTYNVTSYVADTVYGCITYDSYSFLISALPSPPVNMIPSNGLICPNDSVMLSAQTGTNYVWYGPLGNIVGTTQSIYATVPGQYHYTFINATGCSLVSDFVEVKEYSTPYLDAIPGTLICANGSVQIEVQSNENSLIQWQSPLSGNSTTQTVNAPGTYTCNITSCGITTVATIQITPSNTPASIHVVGDSIFCAGDTMTLFANPGMISYEWNPGSVYTPIIQVTQPGTYILEVTDANGCFGHDTVVISSAPVSATPIVSDTLICAGDSLLLLASGGNNISWFADGQGTQLIQTGSTYQTPAIGNNITYYVQIHDTVCASPLTPLEVQIHPFSVPPVISGDSLYCLSDSLELSVPFYGNVSYSWSGPNNLSNSSSSLFISPITYADTGTYTIQVNSQCGIDSAFIQVYIPAMPSAILNSATNVICEGDTLQLYADSNAVNWNWNTGDTSSFIGITQSGIYFTTLSNAAGCTVYSDTISVQVLAAPPAPSVSDTVICVGSNVILTSQSQDVLQWYDQNGSWITTDSVFTSPALTDTTLYLVQITDSVGCTSVFDSVVVNVVTHLGTALISGDTSYCEGTLLLLTGNTNGYPAQWNGPNGYTASQDSLLVDSVTVTQSGYYTLQYQMGTCVSTTDSILITVHPLPSGISLWGDTTYCEGDSLTLWVQSAGMYSYVWESVYGVAQGDTLIIDPVTPTLQSIDLIASTGYCIDTLHVPLVINPLPEIHLYGTQTMCEGDSTLFYTSASGSGNVSWSIPSGANFTSDTVYINAAQMVDEGYYTYTYSSGNGQCSTTDSMHLDIVPLPVFDLGNDTVFCENTQLVLNGPAGFNYYEWSNGTIGISTTVTDSGYISLTIHAPAGCVYTDSLFIDDIACTRPIPNVISPNGDSVNDEWIIVSEGMRNVKCQLFDRWGDLIREWNTDPIRWDGTNMKGEDVSEGTYFYVISFENYFGDPEEFRGHVDVFR